MSLFTYWMEELNRTNNTKTENKAYWKDYFNREKELYKKILASGSNKLTGTLSELAKENNFKDYEFVGYLEGISESLNNELTDLKKLDENSKIDLDINFEKLYYNMHKAKASWLWELEEWDGVLPQEKRDEIYKEYKNSRTVRKGPKVGRNDPCPCGSGKKYKKCCGKRR